MLPRFDYLGAENTLGDCKSGTKSGTSMLLINYKSSITKGLV